MYSFYCFYYILQNKVVEVNNELIYIKKGSYSTVIHSVQNLLYYLHSFINVSMQCHIVNCKMHSSNWFCFDQTILMYITSGVNIILWFSDRSLLYERLKKNKSPKPSHLYNTRLLNMQCEHFKSYIAAHDSCCSVVRKHCALLPLQTQTLMLKINVIRLLATSLI